MSVEIVALGALGVVSFAGVGFFVTKALTNGITGATVRAIEQLSDRVDTLAEPSETPQGTDFATRDDLETLKLQVQEMRGDAQRYLSKATGVLGSISRFQGPEEEEEEMTEDEARALIAQSQGSGNGPAAVPGGQLSIEEIERLGERV